MRHAENKKGTFNRNKNRPRRNRACENFLVSEINQQEKKMLQNFETSNKSSFQIEKSNDCAKYMENNKMKSYVEYCQKQ